MSDVLMSDSPSKDSSACSPGSPGRHPLFGLFGLSEPRTSRLRHDVASSFDIGFSWKVEQFALPIPP
jgi:hypothetical protein